MALGNRVLTTTQDKIMAKVVDTVLNSNVLASSMLAKAKPWSGETMKFPIKYQKGSAGTSFSGTDTLPTTASETRVNLAYTPKFYDINVTLPLDEVSANNTDAKVIDLMSLEVASRAQDMADDIGTLFYSTGTGNSSKDFLGLEAIVDDGTNAATIGGLARSTYTTLNSTVTASSGTLTLLKLETLYLAASSGTIQPTSAYVTEAVYSYYGQLLQAQERIMKPVDMKGRGLTGNTGFTTLEYRGKPVFPDEKCTSGVWYFLNENFLEWRALPMAETMPIKYKSVIEGNDYSSVTGLGFSWTGWIKPTNAAALVAHILLGGEFLTTNPKRHDKLTGITGI